MRFIPCKTYDELSNLAAQIIAHQITWKPNSNLGLATGSTPLGAYRILSEMNQNGEINFRRVKTFNLDEYYPIQKTDPQSYHYFMKTNFFSNINLPDENINFLDGAAKHAEKECEDFETRILRNGGIDLQILGIGRNGHIGFNEPGNTLIAKTHRTALTKSTIHANARFFDSIDQVPKQALTMGVETILKAKKILLLASGTGKQDILKSLFDREINPNIPASLLKLHQNVIVICDNAANPLA